MDGIINERHHCEDKRNRVQQRESLSVVPLTSVTSSGMVVNPPLRYIEET